MSKEVLLRSPPAINRQPVVVEKTKERQRLGEVAGGTAAECAAICCCCPCSVMHLLVLAVYKVPVGLCRKAWKHRKRQWLLKKKKKKKQPKQMTTGLLPRRPGTTLITPAHVEAVAEMKKPSGDDVKDDEIGGGGMEAVRLDQEMLHQFVGGGFWRSPSQRDTS